MKLSQAQRLESFVVSSSLVDSMDQHRERSHAAAAGDARPAVIVGVDGLPGALKAVSWAAIEAERRCVPIELVYAIDSSDDSAETGATGRAVAQANAALAAAAARARNVSASVDIVSEVVDASPLVALARANAVMICLGANGARPPHPGHRVGITTEVLMSADCPVTVVRGEPLLDGWIVAQLGHDASAASLLRTAVEESVLRRMPLRLLTTWSVGGGMPGADRVDLDARLARELDKWMTRHPGLEVAVEPNATLEQYLHDHATQIALFVATDPQSPDIGTVLEPSAEHALRVLSCPVLLHAGPKNTAATDRKTSDPPMLKLGRCALHMARRFTGTMAATMKGFLP